MTKIQNLKYFIRFARPLHFPAPIGKLEILEPKDIIGFNLDNGFMRITLKTGDEIVVSAADVDRCYWPGPVVWKEAKDVETFVEVPVTVIEPAATPTPPAREEKASSKRKQAKSK